MRSSTIVVEIMFRLSLVCHLVLHGLLFAEFQAFVPKQPLRHHGHADIACDT